MYAIYDRYGILRFVNSDREACLDYAELFELNLTNYSLMNFNNSIYNSNDINPNLNQVENNS